MEAETPSLAVLSAACTSQVGFADVMDGLCTNVYYLCTYIIYPGTQACQSDMRKANICCEYPVASKYGRMASKQPSIAPLPSTVLPLVLAVGLRVRKEQSFIIHDVRMLAS